MGMKELDRYLISKHSFNTITGAYFITTYSDNCSLKKVDLTVKYGNKKVASFSTF